MDLYVHMGIIKHCFNWTLLIDISIWKEIYFFCFSEIWCWI